MGVLCRILVSALFSTVEINAEESPCLYRAYWEPLCKKREGLEAVTMVHIQNTWLAAPKGLEDGSADAMFSLCTACSAPLGWKER